MNEEKVLLPRGKWEGLLINFAGAMLVLIQSDFLQKSLSDVSVWPMIGLWASLFLISITRLYVSPRGIDICIWRILIKEIPVKRISCIEVIDCQWKTQIYFEFGKCPRFKREDNLDSLWVFFCTNIYRLIEYIPPVCKKGEVLTLLSTLFPTKVVGVENID